MAVSSPQLQKFLLNKVYCNYGFDNSTKNNITVNGGEKRRLICSALAIDATSSLANVSGIRWGSVKQKGAREEMEDDVVIIQSDELDGFSYAAVFDGHAGFSSVKFLREVLYEECVAALHNGKLLSGNDSKGIEKALEEAFQNADTKLLKWLDANEEDDDESGSTATALFIKNDMVFISHVGDSCVAISRAGKAEVVTESHRPYGSKKASLKEIRRIREAGGWISDGRICGDISVSRAFGDIRFKTKKKEMVEKGVKEGRWSEKFASRIQFKGDLVTANPDVYQVALGSDAEFILLASDGLWDYVNSSDAVNFVRNHLRQHGDVQMASDALAQMALNRRSQDNISIIVADLGRTDWKNLPVQQHNFVYEFGQAVATISVVSLGIWMSRLLSF